MAWWLIEFSLSGSYWTLETLIHSLVMFTLGLWNFLFRSIEPVQKERYDRKLLTWLKSKLLLRWKILFWDYCFFFLLKLTSLGWSNITFAVFGISEESIWHHYHVKNMWFYMTLKYDKMMSVHLINNRFFQSSRAGKHWSINW